MEDDGFNASLSSLSSLSSQTNYQTLTANGNTSNRTTIFQNQQQSNSPPGSVLQEINGPYAIFLFRSNSGQEPFEERKISLDKPCKIGRSVAKIKPEPNNAIFDCKVLSRNHALLWQENSKFYIQDTKSSNGTFLNGNRLGKSNEDSAPFDLTSGDIIQFGVDVTENTKKVTHGCITVEIKLFLKTGVEATAIKPNQSAQSNKIDVQTQELYQLALFLQEAMMREEVLHQKLNSLQTFVDQAKETSENGWLTLIDEDRLLSRIDFLEKQGNLQPKNATDESLKNSINNLINEKFSVENTAKIAIQKMIEERNETAQKYDELKTVYKLRDEECTQVQRVLDESKTSLVELAGKYQELLNQIAELQQGLEDNKLKNQESMNLLEVERKKNETLIEESAHIEKTLNAKIESLIAEKDFTTKRLEGYLSKMGKSDSMIQKFLNNDKVNGDINDEADIKEDPVENGLNGLPDHNDLKNEDEELINGKVEAKLNESSAEVKSKEYIQQELELTKIMNENLLKEIDRLKSIMSTELEEEKSFSSDTSPEKNSRESETKQRNNAFNGPSESESLAGYDLHNLYDFRREFDLIRKKILQIGGESNLMNNSLIKDLVNNVNSLEQPFKRINDINVPNNSKETIHEIILTDAQKEAELHLQKFLKLQEQYTELENNHESIKEKLFESESTMKKLNNEFKDISLQVKIVSYFSTFPLLILVIAIMVSFYPVLARITATDV